MTIQTVTLNTGAKMPLVGLGTWQAKDEDELKNALHTALDAGYRLIDTAFLYQNEAIIGKVLKEYISSGKIKREELFITTKLPFVGHAPEDAEKLIMKQLMDLQLEYIDLYLIHAPTPFAHQPNSMLPLYENGNVVPTTIPHIDTWRVLEKSHKAGKLKAIGISNFNRAQIQDLYDKADIKPANLQSECHIYYPQFKTHELCKKLNISFTAYGPLGSPGRKAAFPNAIWPEADVLKDPIVAQIAAKHNKTSGQVLLRHLTQRGITVIPKSTNPKRIVENFSIFDFKLSAEEMKELDSIDKNVKLFILDYAMKHPFFPWEEEDAELKAKYLKEKK